MAGADPSAMKMTVGTTAVRLAINSDQTPLIQNLGTGNLYVDADPAVTAATGFKMVTGAQILLANDMNRGTGDLYLIADAAATDVRILIVG